MSQPEADDRRLLADILERVIHIEAGTRAVLDHLERLDRRAEAHSGELRDLDRRVTAVEASTAAATDTTRSNLAALGAVIAMVASIAALVQSSA